MSREKAVNGFSYHHRKPKSRGGRGRRKIKVPNDKHKAWHTLVKNADPPEAADIFNKWIDPNYKLFAVNRNFPYLAIEEINAWLNGNSILRMKKSKIIKFRSYHPHYPFASTEKRLPS